MTFVSEIRRSLGETGVLTDPDVLQSYRYDNAGLVGAGMPIAALLPASTAEVVAVVDAARRHGVALVPRGAGSGLSGGANAIDGGAVLSLTRMNNIISVDRNSLTAVVQPGVINSDLSRRVREDGLWYPPDPASWEFSTIGGNIATNAGGLCCVKYGVTRDYVLALEVVLADGSVVRTGRKTIKGVAGYDVVSLLVGSEGTLAVITEATLRLRPVPPPATTLVASFPDLPSTGEAISSICAGRTPSLLEIIDGTTIRAIEDWKRMDLDRDAASILIVQTDLAGDPGKDEIAAVSTICERLGASMVITTADPAEAELLLAARRFAYPALEQLGTTLLDDVAVPRHRVTQLLQAIETVAARHGVTIGTFGHAGDGNLHPTFVFDRNEPGAQESVQAAFDDLVEATLSLDGTVTGEHGVGLLKRSHLLDELGQGGMRLQRAIKLAFDPEGLLNPGKVVAVRGDTG